MNEERRSKNGLIGISAKDLRDLGLHFDKKQTSIPGHIVIPEINAKDFEKDKSKVLPKLVDMAKLANKPGAIVLRPTYRP